jgi:hypothetical protein
VRGCAWKPEAPSATGSRCEANAKTHKRGNKQARMAKQRDGKLLAIRTDGAVLSEPLRLLHCAPHWDAWRRRKRCERATKRGLPRAENRSRAHHGADLVAFRRRRK